MPNDASKPTGSEAPVFDVQIPADVGDVKSFRANLKVGALFLTKDCPHPLRSQIQIRFLRSDGSALGFAFSEVVFLESGKVGLQIINMAPEHRELVEAALKETPVPSAASPQAAVPSAATLDTEAASPPSVTPPQTLSVPRKGELSFHLPTVMRTMYEKVGNGDARQRTGTLVGSVLGLVIQLAQERFVGHVRLIGKGKGEGSFRIFFKEGQIVGLEKEPMDEMRSSAFLLRRKGNITETEYRRVRETQKKTGETDERILKDMGKTHGLASTARKVMHQMLGESFAFRKGPYELEVGVNALARIVSIPINLQRGLCRGIMEAAGQYRVEELLSGLEPFMNYYLRGHKPFPHDVSAFRLSRMEQRFVDITLEKPTRLRSMFAVSALSRLQTLRILYAFYFLGFIDFVTNYQPSAEEVLPHMERTWEDMKTMNHFEILQVHWANLQPDIERGYERGKKEWKEFSLPPDGKKKGQEFIDKILGKIDESFRFLREDGQRRSYRNELIEPTQRKFSAELLAQHARSHILRSERDEARYYLDQALDLDPGNTEFRQLQRETGGSGRS